MSADYRLTRLRGQFAITYTDSAGRRSRRTTGTSDPVEAAAFLQRFIAGRDRPKDITVDMILDHHIKALEGRSSHAVASHQAKALRPAFGRLLPMQVTQEAVGAYVAARQTAGRRPATIRSEVVLLSTALNRAMKDRLITDRPHIATPQDSPPRDRHMSRAEYARFLAACQTYHVKLFAMLALETAARAQAILDLTWDRVDLERGMVDLRLHRFARMKGRGVKPIGVDLVAALSQAKEIALTGHVIEYGGAPVGRIVKGVRAAAVRAGMPWITPHVFRHSAAVWLVEDGHSMAAVAQFLDHADSSITERVYARYSPTFLRSMAATLASGSSEHPSTTHARKKP